jgi:uncharacterized surface protein with fasciclin (FAS1) repeats
MPCLPIRCKFDSRINSFIHLIFAAMKKLFFLRIAELPILVLLVIILFRCTEDPVLWKVKSEQQVISDFVASNPDKYSEFNKLLESVNLTSLLSVRGPFTLFLPNNDAMMAYYKEIGVSSLEALTDKQKKDLAYNHLINSSEIHAGDIGLGALRDTNCVGDFIATEFVGSDIMLNKYSKIIDRDIVCANGYVHEIDHVIAPLVLNIYEVVKADPAFKLFTQGLEVTGLKDTLQVISIPWGNKSARVRFTVLAVPDTIFNRYGIYTIDDLIAHYTDQPDSVTFLENGFYRYMEYHCMAETYFLSALETKLYPILSYDNNISITVDTDYKLNLLKKTGKYTGFIIESSNVPTKNGALHVVNDLLPVIQPDPATFIFDTCNQFELKQMDCYGKYYGKFSDQNTFANVKFEGDFLQYYYKNHDSPSTGAVNMDVWQMFGFGWVEVTTPKIMKGAYKLSGYIWSGNIDFEVYVDGVKTAFVKRSDLDRAPWGEVSWDKTEVHKIKIVIVSWGILFWDTVIFTPI